MERKPKEKKPAEKKEPEKKEPEKKASIPQIQVDKEKSPAPSPKRGSVQEKAPGKKGSIPMLKEPTPEPGSRRGSFIDVGGAPTSRRGSFLVADEKGLAVDESGQAKKLRPGEVLEVRQKRRGSIDMRRASVADVDDRMDKPSIPLKPIPEPPETGPPSIVDFQANQQSTEGKTAYLQFQVEGNPVPKFRWYKDGQEIYEEGRYKCVTDGNTNTVYFCIRKAKSADEGRYKIVAYNDFGEDSCEITLYVGGEEGMDFRAMLKRKQYGKWKKPEDDPDFGNLKAVEDERRASLIERKVSSKSKLHEITSVFDQIKCKNWPVFL